MPWRSIRQNANALAEWVEAEHEQHLTSDGRPAPAALAAIHRRFGLEIVGPPPAL